MMKAIKTYFLNSFRSQIQEFISDLKLIWEKVSKSKSKSDSRCTGEKINSSTG